MRRVRGAALAALWLAALAWPAVCAQDVPSAAPAPKKSSIVSSAGETVLTNGIGDVKPDGPCKADVKAFCKDVSPGDARIALCLTKRIRQALQGNIAGRSVSDKCVADVTAFKIDRSKHINRDVLLARACKDDVAKLCKDANDNQQPGSVLLCLRANQAKASEPCKGEILRTQAEVAEDYRMDPQLYSLCRASVEQLCNGTEAGGEIDCLLAQSKSLVWDCLGQVVRVSKEAASDIRLNMRLFRACAADQAKFCKGVEPGHMRVQECLEDARDRSGFSAGCKEALESVLAQRVADFRLDAGLQEACADDLATTCSTSVADMEADPAKRASALGCLQQFKDELLSQECRDKVHRATSRASRDIRFDELLANACVDDRRKYCDNVQPGSARVIRCLQEVRPNLSQRCAAALFDHEVKMAEDIDFKYPMRRACAWEISRFCGRLPHGHARIIRCLQDALGEEDMSPECKEEVSRDTARMATDYRLNWRLNHACGPDIGRLCGGLCNGGGSTACGGVVLQCLQAKQDNISSQACGEEVFYYQLMEVADFRNDVLLAEACRDDVAKYCADVEPGEGRVHLCLRHHMAFISQRCASEEQKLAALEYRDIRLRPKLAKVCSEERAVYCKDVRPGKARVVKCLMDAMAQPNFGEECRSELQKREDAVKNDYRYDVGVLVGCSDDIDTLCGDAKSKLRGNATVLKCLVDKHSSSSEGCQAEMSRAVRYALWDFKGSAALTAVCNADVDAFCPKGAKARPGGVFTIGAVGRCLSKALVTGQPLSPACRQLVLVAAPRDSRVYLQYPESASALLTKVAELQRAAGMEALLVDPYTRGGGSVTVTGWVALACIMSLVAVSIGGLALLVRRLSGADRPHTQYVKSGDA